MGGDETVKKFKMFSNGYALLKEDCREIIESSDAIFRKAEISEIGNGYEFDYELFPKMF